MNFHTVPRDGFIIISDCSMKEVIGKTKNKAWERDEQITVWRMVHYKL